MQKEKSVKLYQGERERERCLEFTRTEGEKERDGWVAQWSQIHGQISCCFFHFVCSGFSLSLFLFLSFSAFNVMLFTTISLVSQDCLWLGLFSLALFLSHSLVSWCKWTNCLVEKERGEREGESKSRLMRNIITDAINHRLSKLINWRNMLLIELDTSCTTGSQVHR